MARIETIGKLQQTLSAISEINRYQNKISDTQYKIEIVEKETAKIAGMSNFMFCLAFALTFLFGFIGTCVLPVIGTIIGALCGFVIAAFIYDKPGKRRGEKAQTYYDGNMPQLMDTLEETVNNYEKLMNDTRTLSVLESLPQDYLSAETVQSLIKLLENQRADTLKEAINLYEDILHKNRLEIMQQQQVDMAKATLQLQSQQLSVAQYQAKITESMAKTQQQIAATNKKIVRSNKATAKNTRRTADSARYANIVNTINTIHHWKK